MDQGLKNQRLRNETAMLMATAILRVVGKCIRADHHRKAFDYFFNTCKEGIDRYEVQRERMLHRLRPLRN